MLAVFRLVLFTFVLISMGLVPLAQAGSGKDPLREEKNQLSAGANHVADLLESAAEGPKAHPESFQFEARTQHKLALAIVNNSSPKVQNVWRKLDAHFGKFVAAQWVLALSVGSMVGYQLGGLANGLPAGLLVTFVIQSTSHMIQTSLRPKYQVLGNKSATQTLLAYYFERLRERGIPVPQGDSSSWMSENLERVPARDYAVLRTRKQVANEVDRFRQKLIETALLLDEQPVPREIVLGIVEMLPDVTSLKSRALSRLNLESWRREKIAQLLAAKLGFQRIFAPLGLAAAGADLSDIILPTDDPFRSRPQIFKAGFPFEATSNLVLARLGPKLLEYPHAEHISRLSEKGVVLTLDAVFFDRDSSTQGLLVGKASAVINIEITQNNAGATALSFLVTFSTRKTSKEDILAEGNWIEPLAHALETQLWEHPDLNSREDCEGVLK